MTSRSMSSDVRFETDDKEKTGSYEINPERKSGDVHRGSGTSGDYDFPDPTPQGKRTTYYDNQGIQKVRVKVA